MRDAGYEADIDSDDSSTPSRVSRMSTEELVDFVNSAGCWQRMMEQGRLFEEFEQELRERGYVAPRPPVVGEDLPFEAFENYEEQHPERAVPPIHPLGPVVVEACMQRRLTQIVQGFTDSVANNTSVWLSANLYVARN